ncbi:type II secretion system F family protein [Sandaracinobacter sp. RS1-74]|uniref:type II secretion system F family protein n=1 Tax=Sandaracinobacteroides sayramensis TaxID=2913411 RepID=UPI001EDB8715|nr:type II secretion system F family protein [Sandaracinobacteroides sayramensis]MCG2840569.1 type II secretion system F family protein [Sandaracinobacteroides sayramensis]
MLPDSSTLVLTLLFFGVVLLVEGAYYYYRDVHAPKSRVGRRLDSLRSGGMATEVQASLKREKQSRSETLVSSILNKLELKLTQAGMRMTAERLLMLMGVATAGIALAAPILLGIADMLNSVTAFILVLVFAVAIGTVLPLILLDRKAAKRMKKFEEQFPVALDIFVRGLRAGHPVTGALDLLVEEMPDPIGSEFAMVVAEISYGYDLRDALDNLAGRVQTTDIQMFSVCVAIQAETGGNLADILEGLSKVIRERQSMVLKVRALASEGKMTAIVLSVLPIGTFLFVFSTQPHFYLDVVDDPWFLPGLIGLSAWYTMGIMLIRKLVDLKV